MINYTLKTPVTVAGKTITELTFRKPKTGDMCVLDKFDGDMTKMVALMATISDTTIPAFREIELDDFTAISELVAPLLGESKPSPVSGSI